MKSRVHLEEFCRNFYDENIMHPIIARTNFDKVRDAVIEADPTFASVTPEAFEAEMTLLRFEVFGLAWLHELGGKEFGDQLLVSQSEFTKRYLEEQGRLDTWESMEPYNRAVARSSTLRHKGDTPSGRAYLARTNSERLQMCSQWDEQGFDLKCAARVANRLFTEEAWEIRLTLGCLMLTLWERLGCYVDQKGKIPIMAIIIGLYNGARQALREVEIEP